MKSNQMTIFALMALVLVFALAFAVLRMDGPLKASVFFSLAIVACLVATLQAVVRKTASRRGWIGFALFGWAYLLIVFGPWFSAEVAPHLATTKLLNALYAELGGNRASRQWEPAASHRVQTREFNSNPYRDFQRSGHSILTFVFASAGAVFAAATWPKPRVDRRWTPAPDGFPQRNAFSGNRPITNSLAAGRTPHVRPAEAWRRSNQL